MVKQETIVLLLLILLLILVLFIKYYNNALGVTNALKVEGFDSDISLTELINQYEQLDNDKKAKLAQIIGSPIPQSDMIHKSAIPPQRECPVSKFNELDYVKRSSIPPCPEPKPCIAPKVVVDANLCKKQDCPPCPTCQECSKVETVRVPVFVTKTVTVDKDGKELKTTVEQSDVEVGENLLASAKLSSGSDTETVPTEPEPTNTDGGFLGALKDLFDFEDSA